LQTNFLKFWPADLNFSPASIRTGGLLRAIIASKWSSTQDWLLRRRIARSKPGC